MLTGVPGQVQQRYGGGTEERATRECIYVVARRGATERIGFCRVGEIRTVGGGSRNRMRRYEDGGAREGVYSRG